MCLAVPGEIIRVEGEALARSGEVRFGALLKQVSLGFVPEARVGDYVLVHAGVAIATIREEEAARTLAYLEEIGETER